MSAHQGSVDETIGDILSRCSRYNSLAAGGRGRGRAVLLAGQDELDHHGLGRDPTRGDGEGVVHAGHDPHLRAGIGGKARRRRRRTRRRTPRCPPARSRRDRACGRRASTASPSPDARSFGRTSRPIRRAGRVSRPIVFACRWNIAARVRAARFERPRSRLPQLPGRASLPRYSPAEWPRCSSWPSTLAVGTVNSGRLISTSDDSRGSTAAACSAWNAPRQRPWIVKRLKPSASMASIAARTSATRSVKAWLKHALAARRAEAVAEPGEVEAERGDAGCRQLARQHDVLPCRAEARLAAAARDQHHLARCCRARAGRACQKAGFPGRISTACRCSPAAAAPTTGRLTGVSEGIAGGTACSSQAIGGVKSPRSCSASVS